MKVLKFTSILLALLLTTSATSITAFSVENKSEDKIEMVAVENFVVPDDFYNNPVKNILLGSSFDLIYSDGTKEKIEFDNLDKFDSVFYWESDDFYTNYSYINKENTLSIRVENYLAYNLNIEISNRIDTSTDDYTEGKIDFTITIPYPDDYQLSKGYFYDNGMLYYLNDNDTVELVNANAYYYKSIIIPEEIRGKKVTKLRKDSCSMASGNIEIPETVTDIDKEAFNIKTLNYLDNHFYDDEVSYYFVNCNDDEKVQFIISSYNQISHLKLLKKYFSDIDYSVYPDEEYSIVAKLSKKQIDTMIKDSETYFNVSLYKESKVSYAIDKVFKSGNVEKLSAKIETQKLSSDQKIKEVIYNVANECFPEGWARSTSGSTIYAVITPEIAEKLKNCEYVKFVSWNDAMFEFGGVEVVRYFCMNEEDTANLILYNYGVSDLFNKFINEFFSEYKQTVINNTYDENCVIVEGVTSETIEKAFVDNDEYFYVDEYGFYEPVAYLEFLGDEIFVNNCSTIIYCKENSCAEKYAKEHNIKYFTTPMPIKPQHCDVNMDGEVSISDATEIQLFLAQLKDLEYDQIDLADINDDSEISVNDVTQLQLKLAQLIE